MSGGLGIGRVQLEHRAAEGQGPVQNGLHTVVQMEHASVYTESHTFSLSWTSQQQQLPPLPPPHGSQQQNIAVTHASPGDSFVITVNAEQATDQHNNNMASTSNTTTAENFLNNIREAAAAHHTGQHQPNNNNNDIGEGDAEMMRQSPEMREFLSLLKKQDVPIMLLIFLKNIYDHVLGILILLGLYITFSYANTVVKREIAKQSRRSLTSLLLIVSSLLGCILFIYYLLQDQKLYLSLVFIPPYSQPLDFWDLLWIVIVTDFVLKLVTIMLKVSVASLPNILLPYKKRGKCYLFLEATSQLYRSLAPIQPCLYYLLESYQGREKVVGMVLCAAYVASKGIDLNDRAKLFRSAFLTLLQNLKVGVSPNENQLQRAGKECPICHDEFETPVLLSCHHIFCEACVATWLDTKQTCPLCRTKVVDDPSWRDGTTSHSTQLY